MGSATAVALTTSPPHALDPRPHVPFYQGIIILLLACLHSSIMTGDELFSTNLCDFLLYRACGNKGRPPKDTILRGWMDNQDKSLAKMKDGVETDMTEDRKMILDEVKFPWKLSHAERWNLNYQELVAFHSASGHCKVPRDAAIGKWVATQRKEIMKFNQDKKTSMTEDKIIKLDAVGFETTNDWNKNFRQLATFQRDHGHCRVPHSKGSLGRWVYYQRERFQKLNNGGKSTMTEDEIEKLDGIGFWDDE